jgi:hypothetical protein
VQITWAGQTSAVLSYDNSIFNHITIVVDTIMSKTRLYINAKKIIETSTSNLATGNTITQFFLLSDTSNQTIDDLRLYNRSLSDDEINMLYTIDPAFINNN